MGLRYGFGSEENRLRPGVSGVPGPQRIRDDLPYDATPAAISQQQLGTQTRAADTTRMAEENSQMQQKIGANLGAAVQAPVEGYVKGRKAQQEYELGQQTGQLGAEELQSRQMKNEADRAEMDYGKKDAAELGLRGAKAGQNVADYRRYYEAQGKGAYSDAQVAAARQSNVSADIQEATKGSQIAAADLAPKQAQASINASNASVAASGTQTQLNQQQLAEGKRKQSIDVKKQEMRQVAGDPAKLKAYIDTESAKPGADKGVLYQAAFEAAGDQAMQNLVQLQTDPRKAAEVADSIANVRKAKQMVAGLTGVQGALNEFKTRGSDFFEDPASAGARENLAQALEPFNPSMAQQVREGFHLKSLTGSKATGQQAVDMIVRSVKSSISLMAHQPGMSEIPDFQELAEKATHLGGDSDVYGGTSGHNAFMNNGPAAQKPAVETIAQRTQRIQNKVNEDESWQNNQILPPENKPMTDEERVQKIRASRAKKPTTAGVPNQPSARDIARPTLNQGTGYVDQGVK